MAQGCPNLLQKAQIRLRFKQVPPNQHESPGRKMLICSFLVFSNISNSYRSWRRSYCAASLSCPLVHRCWKAWQIKFPMFGEVRCPHIRTLMNWVGCLDACGIPRLLCCNNKQKNAMQIWVSFGIFALLAPHWISAVPAILCEEVHLMA